MSLNSIRRAVAALWPHAGGWRALPPMRGGGRGTWLAVGGALLVFAVALLAPELSRSAPSVASTTGELGRADPTGLPVGFDLVAKLLVVLALIYATASVARRYLLRAPSRSQSLVHLLETTTIAPKKNVYVIQIAGRVLVLGATESGLSTLTQFDDPETVASLIAGARPNGVGFQRYLDASRSRGAPAQPLDLLAQATTRLRTGSDR